MPSILAALKRKKLLVSDGAWGTMLMGAGLRPGECPELWSVERPEALLNIGRQYLDAGADLITTNSFGASRFNLARYGLGERAAELNAAAAAISRQAAGPDHCVIASVGPTGKMVLMGDVTEQDLYDAFCEQVVALEKGGADACCIETMSAIDEAIQAVRAAKDHTTLEVICTFTFEREMGGVYYTMMGVTPEQMATALVEAGADIIGTNCSQGPLPMVSIVREMRAAAPTVPILVHPNAGCPTHTDAGDIYPETPESMAACVHDLVSAGADIIGGCCGTTPAHIRAIARAVDIERAQIA
ncbi:MAG: hypothetical protein AMXMBFR4_18450 [Candidatus Hydrogenedentota bacterium]